MPTVSLNIRFTSASSSSATGFFSTIYINLPPHTGVENLWWIKIQMKGPAVYAMMQTTYTNTPDFWRDRPMDVIYNGGVESTRSLGGDQYQSVTVISTSLTQIQKPVL